MFFLSFLIIIFLIFSFIITPIAGGCLLLSSIMIGLFFMLLVFSVNFIWILPTIFIVYILIYFHKLYKWFKLPTYDEYINNNLGVNAIICSKCSGNNIKHLGLFYKRSKLRFYICQTCGNILYRFKLI